jgi:malate dehydrogenase (oxaloacetate-decarboxylating)(NADP+)
LCSLIGKKRLNTLSAEQAEFARDQDDGLTLQEVMDKHKPTILLGMTAVGGLFKEQLIQSMASNCKQPKIFPLSNPTVKAECTAEQAFEWTNGTCIFASGSPFEPVTLARPFTQLNATTCMYSPVSDWEPRWLVAKQ